jgi:hypothetical protein
VTPEQATSLVARLRDFFPLGDVPTETGGAYASVLVDLEFQDAAAGCRRVVETCTRTWPTMAEILDACHAARGERLAQERAERERAEEEEYGALPIEEAREYMRLIATGGVRQLEPGGGA